MIMHSKELIIRELYKTGVVAVIRVEDPSALIEVAEALLEGGVNFVEITMTVPGALKIIEKASDKLNDKGVYIGVGTVLKAETGRAAILAGASYVVSPIHNPDVIEMCKGYNVAMMPGAMTPTEAFTAWQAGADVIKIFPADVGGPRFFRDMRGPLPDLKLMPTGGVNLETASEFIKAGAYAVGVGGALVAKSLIAARDFDAIALNAQKFVKVVTDAR